MRTVCRSALDGKAMEPVELIEALEGIGGEYAIGRGIHLGDTVLGTKGRVAFEAPAAEILLNAHRELEKLTLSPLQMRIKESVAQNYGDFVHEGKQLDPVCRDIEALLDSSQATVTGDVKADPAGRQPVRCRRGFSPTRSWPQPRACTAKPPASGRRRMRSVTRGYSRCRACCSRGPLQTEKQKRVTRHEDRRSQTRSRR